MVPLDALFLGRGWEGSEGWGALVYWLDTYIDIDMCIVIVRVCVRACV